MFPRPGGALVALALVFASGEGAALAQPPAPAPAPPPAAAPAPPPAAALAPPPQAQPRGAIVVAVSAGAGPAARALAFDVYRDADLRPSVDDATARVLAGEAPPDGAPTRLKELAELRASIVQAFAPPPPPPSPPAPGAAPAPPPSDLVARRLLASLGTELGATLVVSVHVDNGRAFARALRSATSSFERVELGPTVDVAPDGARTYRWPLAVATLRGVLAPPPATPLPAELPKPPAPLAPRAEAAPAAPAPVEPTPFYKSPWFWGSVGGAAAIGLSVFLISRATSTTSDVHLMGKVGP